MLKKVTIHLTTSRVNQGRFITKIEINADGERRTKQRVFNKSTAIFSLYKALMGQVDHLKDVELTVTSDNTFFMAEINDLANSQGSLAGYLRNRLAENNVLLKTK